MVLTTRAASREQKAMKAFLNQISSAVVENLQVTVQHGLHSLHSLHSLVTDPLVGPVLAEMVEMRTCLNAQIQHSVFMMIPKMAA